MSFAATYRQAATRLGNRHLADVGRAREIVYRRPCEATRAR